MTLGLIGTLLALSPVATPPPTAQEDLSSKLSPPGVHLVLGPDGEPVSSSDASGNGEDEPPASKFTSYFNFGLGAQYPYVDQRTFEPDPGGIQSIAELIFGWKPVGELKLGYWGHHGTQRDENIEQDLTAKFKSRGFHIPRAGDIRILAEWNQYLFDADEPKHQVYEEVSLGVLLENRLNPQIMVNHDYETASGTFTELSINPEVRVFGTPMNLTLAALHNDRYNWEGSALAGFRGDLSKAFDLGPGELKGKLRCVVLTYDNPDANEGCSLGFEYVISTDVGRLFRFSTRDGNLK